jgi:hypothetical protein
MITLSSGESGIVGVPSEEEKLVITAKRMAAREMKRSLGDQSDYWDSPR